MPCGATLRNTDADGSRRLQPRPRCALRRCDLLVRHLLRNLLAQASCLTIALHRGQIEPLVCADIVDRNTAPDRIHHAEIEKRAGVDRPLSEDGIVGFTEFKTS